MASQTELEQHVCPHRPEEMLSALHSYLEGLCLHQKKTQRFEDLLFFFHLMAEYLFKVSVALCTCSGGVMQVQLSNFFTENV
jgi:hypothetical protein